MCSAATRKTCVSAMNIGGLGCSRFTKLKPCRYRKVTAVQYAHGLHNLISTGRQRAIETRCGAATRAYHSVSPELCRASLRCSSTLQSDPQRHPMRYLDAHPKT